MVDRIRIRALRDAGHTLAQIAAQIGVGQSSVQRILKEPTIVDAASAPTPKSRRIGRPSSVEAFRKQVVQLFETEPELPTVEVLSRLRALGYGGGKSALYELVKSVRPSGATVPEVRFEGVPGEFSQHDFGNVEVTYADGSRERVRFFASRLKYSRWTHVAIVPDEKVESLVRALLLSFESFGGLPLRAVFDNPKTIVIGRDGNRAEYNPTFAGVMVDYGLGVELCTPRRANQKGSVENLVGWVKHSFFRVRRFHDRADLQQQLAQWLDEVNLQRPSRATNQRPIERMDAERARLSPMRIPAAEYALRFPIRVGTTGLVEHNGVRYSMPPQTIGIPGTLLLYTDRVRILMPKGIQVDHPRYPAQGNTCWREEDRTAMLASVHAQRGQLYFKRQRMLELGPPAEHLLTEWVHTMPFYWPRHVHRLYDLLVQHGPTPTLAAIERALADGRTHINAIDWLLTHRQEVQS